MKLAFISPEGVLLTDLPTVQHKEVGTTAEPTPITDLFRVAAEEAQRQSTKEQQ